ncbi:MAG: DUF3343 domain-containing protein [Hespellia sp.]|nr:DUF3343 domain-containing protein [Hespellia sp.]
MRRKERHLVISFEATTMAMMMEELCKKQHMPGRIIPLPPVISAGCGLAWMAEAENEKMWEAFMQEHGIVSESIQFVEI